jgi:4'-phosphopantetheinyl transferase
MELSWPTAKVPPRLGVDEAHVWAVPFDGSAGGDGALLSVLSDEEQQRADEFRLERPRQQFVCTRGALRVLLGHYLGERPEDVSFSFEAIAKPRLAEKHAASNLRFNVSHSGDLGLIAITSGCDIGVDVEHRRPVKNLEQLAQRYFHPAEIEAVTTTAIDDRNDAFFRCWTAKEAVLKAYGTGIAGALDAFEVPLAPSFAGWIDLSGLNQKEKASSCWLGRLTLDNDYIAAVALVGCHRQVTCFTFTL